MVDDDGVRRGQEALETVGNLGELHPRNLKNLLEVLVVVDVLSLLRVLQTIGLGQRVGGCTMGLICLPCSLMRVKLLNHLSNVVSHLDVLPDSIDNVRSRGCVHAQQSSQLTGQLVLYRLSGETHSTCELTSDP